jgi:hypothetical protein
MRWRTSYCEDANVDARVRRKTKSRQGAQDEASNDKVAVGDSAAFLSGVVKGVWYRWAWWASLQVRQGGEVTREKPGHWTSTGENRRKPLAT